MNILSLIKPVTFFCVSVLLFSGKIYAMEGLSVSETETDNKYMSRFQGPTLDEKESGDLLKQCVAGGHPIAELEEAERVLMPFLRESGIGILEGPPTTCHGAPIVGASSHLFVDEITMPSTSSSELSAYIDLVKKAMRTLTSPKGINYQSYFSFLPETSGILGLKPHDSQQVGAILQSWQENFNQANLLVKGYQEEDTAEVEVCTFSDRYPTTPYLLEELKKPENAELALQVNQFLTLLDQLPEENLLPWWKDSQWQPTTE
ncbi:MAG: hypothetical protein K2X28_04440 [Alphaproteobacteria bacterium]|nr:hypothetical protein [Alphaproteobacteria bacterium]